MDVYGYSQVLETDGLVIGYGWHGSISWPDRGASDRWAANLTAYPRGGLERADLEHEDHLLAAGWRQQGECWSPPQRQRRGIEQVGAIVRKAVQRLDRRDPPAHTVGPMVACVVGFLEALADLLFYPTTDEAFAAGASALRAAGGGKRHRGDPLRPAFRDAGEALSRASEPVAARSLGCGPQSYAVAESRGRTRTQWDEIHCASSHVSGCGVKGLHAVERAVDAQRSVMGAELDALDREGLLDWLGRGLKKDERVRRFRSRLALQRGVGALGAVSDVTASEATADMTDRAILERLTRARARLDRRLARLPEHAERLAKEMGDKTFLAPLAMARKTKEPRRPRGPVERIHSHAPRFA